MKPLQTKKQRGDTYRRATAYARGMVANGDVALYEQGALQTGWLAGYRAALRDKKR